MNEVILIVDDEPNYQLVIGQMLLAEGYEVLSAGSGDEAYKIFLDHPETGLVLTDMTMPNGNGIELLEKVKALRPEVPVVMLTAHGTVELAVKAMKRGASDYLTKPYKNDELTKTVSIALEVSRLARQNKELKEELVKRHGFHSLVGKSKAMRELYQLLEKVSPTRANVLITGESGTGKELVARAIHYNSPRKDGSFVAVNCSALTQTLLESELFGYEKGAFTGASHTRPGRFELAHGGTLFLDEIGEMGGNAQVKLLRALQERSIERVGSGVSISVDARVVAATNRDLKEEIAAGRFREDLFYRLNVVRINVPPLRERMEDLPLLIEHFMRKHSQDSSQEYALDPETKRLLFAHSWPGNVRELENVIERGLVLVTGNVIQPDDLPLEIRELSKRPPADPASLSRVPERTEKPKAGNGGWPEKFLEAHPIGTVALPKALMALEEGLLRRSLDREEGVQARAADLLGLKRNVFKYKWDKFESGAPDPLALEFEELLPRDAKLTETLELLEETMLRMALDKSDGKQSDAALALGLKRNHMLYKVKKYPDLKKALND
ncbi:MAG: sigma-54 dependent transcriptional regulator [Deltaproteobacteria bacterium]|jgi:two-component system NtrC family response regulator|nr:sigma-54 dependent transcriptional regulator [Deltaproteobacteria bacterium]